VVLRALPGAAGEPKFSMRDAAGAEGLVARWDPLLGRLELDTAGGVQGRLLLGSDSFLVQGRRIHLASALELVDGAPALDADSLRRAFQALGAPDAEWSALAADEIPVESAAVETPSPATATPTPTFSATPAAPDAAHFAARPLQGGPIHTVIIDAGHGGYDPGAHGHHGLKEKNVCLAIALKLKRVLAERDPSLQVVLTRDTDVFISLQERTQRANRAKGDLFVSIHNNASPNRSTHGTQVFFFDSQSSDRAAADLSLRENDEANQLDILMTDLAKSIVRDQSIGFASQVQNALGKALNLKHRDISYAPFYVLARTQMPAILVEVAFITNDREERLLGDSAFQSRVATSLAQGIEAYSRFVGGTAK